MPPPTSARDLARLLASIDRRLTALERTARTPQLQNASMTAAAITVYDEDGTTARQHIGMQPDGTVGIVATNGPAPSAPSAPLVTPSLGGLRVAWDGTLGDGTALPADFDHIAVHVSQTSDFTPDSSTFAGTITKAGDGGMLPVTPLPYEEHFVRLVGVNTSGTGGDPSEETAGTPVKVDGPDLTAGSVTAETIAAGAVTADKLAAILVVATRILAGDPAGARVELNEDGLRVYDSDDALKVSLDAATGDAVFTGDITGSTITGSTLQVADSGGDILAEVSDEVGLASKPGLVTYSTDGTGTEYYSALTDARVAFGVVGTDSPSQEGGLSFSFLGDVLYELLLSSGRAADKVDAQISLLSGDGSPPTIDLNAEQVNVLGALSVTDTPVTEYTITVGGAGSAAWTSQVGYAYQFGKLWFVQLYLDSSTAGSGSSTVTLSLPFTPDRTVRQMLPLYGSMGSTLVVGAANVFVGGSGAMLDNLRVQNGGSANDVVTLTGSMITNNDFYSVQGWLREA